MSSDGRQLRFNVEVLHLELHDYYLAPVEKWWSIVVCQSGCLPVVCLIICEFKSGELC